MFNGMMDPELFRLFLEQMSRMSPAELARIQEQMMSDDPESENMSPEELKMAVEIMKNGPEEMAHIVGEKMANASPQKIAAIRARADAQMAYEYDGAEVLKKQGNQLHSKGKYQDAAQKYLHAKNNLKKVPAAKGRALQLACSLNLMSCYLNTQQFHDCVKEGCEVLAYDEKNVKGLYRRGHAYKELGQLENAVSDLRKVLEVFPNAGTVAEVIREANESLGKGGITRTSTAANDKRKPLDCSVTQSEESSRNSKDQTESVSKRPTTESECLHALKDDPDTIRSFLSFISQADPEVLARMGSGKSGELPADMLETTSSMIGNMSPEELQNMVKMAVLFQGGSSPFNGSPFDADLGSGSVPANLSPEMLKTTGDMMGKMSPEGRQRMFEMGASLKQDSVPSSSGSSSDGLGLSSSNLTQDQDLFGDITNFIGECSNSYGSNQGSTSQPSFPTSMGDMQEQMRNQMKDMFSSMLKNMSPDMMASMSEQFGLKLSKEDAAKALAMASLLPEVVDKMMRWVDTIQRVVDKMMRWADTIQRVVDIMMRWADRIERVVEGAKKTKNWLLGRRGMVLALCMLILAIIIHFYGFIGR